jgi:hypothetical protein
MRNTAINTLSYTGIVTLSQYIGSKKIKIAQVHNAGGSALFDFFADCLIGDWDIAKVTRPTKIRILERKVLPGENNYSYEPASGFIFLRSAPEKDGKLADRTSLRYSFTIPRDLIENITNFENLGLGLYTHGTPENDYENFAAFCLIGLDKNELANASLVVDWQLVITNNGVKI